MFVNGADIKAGRDERSQRTSDADDSLKESEVMVNQTLPSVMIVSWPDNTHSFLHPFAPFHYYLLTYEEVWHQSQGKMKGKEAKRRGKSSQRSIGSTLVPHIPIYTTSIRP